MIQIRVEYCDGCGACVEVCPSGALYLVNGKATVDEARCRECEMCVSTCPRHAIVVVGERVGEAEPLRVPAVEPEPMALRVGAEPISLPVRSRLVPLVGAALVWAGREIVPRLADYLVSGLDRRIIAQAWRASDRALRKWTVEPGFGRGHTGIAGKEGADDPDHLCG